MSDINAILSALSEAKAAQDRLPELEATIAELQRTLEERQQTIDHQNSTISSTTESLANATVRIGSLEVERDDYGFRLLQTEETLASLRLVIGSVVGTLGGTVKAEPVAEVNDFEPMPETVAAAEAEAYRPDTYNPPKVMEYISHLDPRVASEVAPSNDIDDGTAKAVSSVDPAPVNYSVEESERLDSSRLNRPWNTDRPDHRWL